MSLLAPFTPPRPLPPPGPTVLDLYLARGRVLKHAGRLVEASEEVDKGRSYDLADRYLNTKATK